VTDERYEHARPGDLLHVDVRSSAGSHLVAAGAQRCTRHRSPAAQGCDGDVVDRGHAASRLIGGRPSSAVWCARKPERQDGTAGASSRGADPSGFHVEPPNSGGRGAFAFTGRTPRATRSTRSATAG
jgi:hypothetical protein